MQPGTTTTTTEILQWQCATCRADWKMVRQMTTCCPHGGGCCCHGTPPPPLPSAGNHPAPHCHHHHHHHHRQEEVQVKGTSSSRTALAGAEGSNSTGHNNNIITTTLDPARGLVVAEVCWEPETYLMVQQLREFESLNDEVVALRVQLQEYTEEIHKGKKDNAGGMNWLLALPPNVRDVLIMARDVIESFIAISASAPAN